MRFAAIDIGSNGVRLLLSQVLEIGEQPIFKKESLIRIPIRLGEDVFTTGFISPEKESQLIKTMVGFKYLIDTYDPVKMIACATAAMREASNSRSIIKKIRANSGIEVELVDGKREAQIIYSNHARQMIDRDDAYLSIDVGGGSTEIILFSNYRSIASQSFDIGTVRMIKGMVDEEVWKEMKRWLKDVRKNYRALKGIGSGGNINKIYRITRVKEGKPLSYKKVRQIHDNLEASTMDERLRKYRLRQDRADVIVPAAKVFLAIMKWAGIKKLYVPQIGLGDGLVHIMYEDLRKQLDHRKKLSQVQIGFTF